MCVPSDNFLREGSELFCGEYLVLAKTSVRNGIVAADDFSRNFQDNQTNEKERK